MSLDELVELVLHLLDRRVPQGVELPPEGVVHDLYVSCRTGGPEIPGVSLDERLALRRHLLVDVFLHQRVAKLLQLLRHENLPHCSELEKIRPAHRQRLPHRPGVLVPLRQGGERGVRDGRLLGARGRRIRSGGARRPGPWRRLALADALLLRGLGAADPIEHLLAQLQSLERVQIGRSGDLQAELHIVVESAGHDEDRLAVQEHEILQPEGLRLLLLLQLLYGLLEGLLDCCHPLVLLLLVHHAQALEHKADRRRYPGEL
mmetsp:Transcript_7661/g.22634  ORF Transcript_7661/g.22634 Transcript_7661/m.22634 type:complete len:261 (-) Transcript_7661:2156-2938(-)